jgi:hypothetical protein
MALSLSRRAVQGRFSTNGKSREEVATRATGAHMPRAIAGISGRINRHRQCRKGALLSISRAILLKIHISIILRRTPSWQTIKPYFVNSSRETPTATRAICVTMPTALMTLNLPVLICPVMYRLTKLLTCTMGTKPNNKCLIHPCSPFRHPR